MTYENRSANPVDFMLVVDRLSTQDQHRIARLIDLLRDAPDGLRKRVQRRIAELVLDDSRMHLGSIARVDAIISQAEQELEQHGTVTLPGRTGQFAGDGVGDIQRRFTSR